MSAPPPIEPPGVFDDLRPGAIFYGAVIDHLATLAASLLLFLVFTGFIAGETREVDEEQLEALAQSTAFLVASLVTGTLCTVLGAYLGATRAGRAHLRHGGWIAVTSAALALLFTALEGQAPAVPWWLEATGWLLIIPAGLAGGALAARGAPESEREF